MVTVAIITSATAGIMSTETLPRYRLVAASVLGVGVFLFALSVPRVVAYFHLSVVPPVIVSSLNSGRGIEAASLYAAFEQYAKAEAYLPNDAVIKQDLGRLELRRADLLEENPVQHAAALRLASDYLRSSIQAAPARAFPWALEAYVQSRLPGPSVEVNRLLRMSYFLGPHEASSLLLRARVGVDRWEFLDADVRQFTSNDLEEMWRDIRLHRLLIPIYLDAPVSTRIEMRKLILTDRESELRFDRMLRRALASRKSN